MELAMRHKCALLVLVHENKEGEALDGGSASVPGFTGTCRESMRLTTRFCVSLRQGIELGRTPRPATGHP